MKWNLIILSFCNRNDIIDHGGINDGNTNTNPNKNDNNCDDNNNNEDSDNVMLTVISIIIMIIYNNPYSFLKKHDENSSCQSLLK